MGAGGPADGAARREIEHNGEVQPARETASMRHINVTGHSVWWAAIAAYLSLIATPSRSTPPLVLKSHALGRNTSNSRRNRRSSSSALGNRPSPGNTSLGACPVRAASCFAHRRSCCGRTCNSVAIFATGPLVAPAPASDAPSRFSTPRQTSAALASVSCNSSNPNPSSD